MASKRGSSRPWIWAIEALASNQVDASVLIDVVKNFPGEIDEKNVREIASLRILESLSVLEKGKIGDVSLVDFSQSDGCENVLRQLLLKSSGSNHTSIESETLKSDLKPFIQGKRTCLPDCALKQLKDVILKDTHLLPASVKERSASQIKNQIPEGTDLDAAQNSPVRDLSTAKRVINDSVPANQGGLSACNQLIVYNAFDPFANAVTKLKQDAFCTQKAKGHVSVSSRNTEDNFGRTVHHTARDGSDLRKEPQIETLKEVISSENVDCDCVASKRLKTSPTVDDADLLHHKQLATHDVDKINQATSGEEQGINMGAERTKNDGQDSDELRTLGSFVQAVTQKTIYVDRGKEKCEHSFSRIAPSSVCSGKDKAAMEHYHEPEILCDDDICLDNNGTIIVKRNTFINYLCTDSQDSVATADGTKRLLCMICKKGDQLLVCSSDFCQRVVHESCMGVAPTFDATGSFFCPFCSYSQAISEYVASKKKASLARKALVAFICRDEYRLRHSSNMVHRTDQNQLRESEDIDKCVEQSSGVNVVNRENKTPSKNISNGEASVFCDSLCGEKGRAVSDGRNDVVSEDGERGRTVNGGIDVASEDKENAKNCRSSACCQSPIEQEKQVLVENKKRKKETQAVQDCEVHHSNCKDVNISCGSEQHAATEKEQDDFCHLQVVLPFELAKPPGSDVENTPREKSEKSIACYNSLRVHKRRPDYTYPAIPQLRRKIVPWTNAEEEALKEGVKRFASHNEGKMPWKEILEFGSEIFEKCRTAVDLKDKWRNICKKSPKSMK